jgi:hypothetical protein
MKKVKLKPLFIPIALIFLVNACGYAKHVKVKPGKTGVVTLPYGHSKASRNKANELMSQNCHGRGYQIVQEKEVVVGKVHRTRVHSHEHKKKYRHPKKRIAHRHESTVATTTTVPKKEWRIYYECL